MKYYLSFFCYLEYSNLVLIVKAHSKKLTNTAKTLTTKSFHPYLNDTLNDLQKQIPLLLAKKQ